MNIRFVNFSKLDEEAQLTILEWRNRDEIRKNMLNQEIISKASHLSFCASLKDRKDCIYYLVIVDEKMTGVINYVHLNYERKEGEYGLYTIDERPGIGSIVGQLAVNHFFEDLKFEKLNIEVLENNLNAKRYNEVCLNFSNPVFIPSEYLCAGKCLGAYHYVMTLDDWTHEIKSKYDRNIRRVSFSFED